jgi:hypothetical protein
MLRSPKSTIGDGGRWTTSLTSLGYQKTSSPFCGGRCTIPWSSKKLANSNGLVVQLGELEWLNALGKEVVLRRKPISWCCFSNDLSLYGKDYG